MKPLFSVPIKFGLIGSILAMIVIIALYYSGTHPLLIPIFFDYRIVLFVIFILLGLKEFKDYRNGGFLQFWQGMIIGIGIYLIIGLLVGVFVVVYSNIDVDFHSQYIEGTIKGLELDKEQLVNTGSITISEEEFQNQVEMLKNSKPYVLGIDYFIKSSVLGFFLTILLSVILRKTEPRFVK